MQNESNIWITAVTNDVCESEREKQDILAVDRLAARLWERMAKKFLEYKLETKAGSL